MRLIFIGCLIFFLLHCGNALPGSSFVSASPKRYSTSHIIRFSGYDWYVKEGRAYPGPNHWARNNVWVDSNGYLHLKITNNNGKWTCAEVFTKERLGFGKYQFWVIGAIDKLDKNIVLGLFNYPQDVNVIDKTNEIDIEYSRWGVAEEPNGYFTVYPAQNRIKEKTFPFFFSLTGEYTTHQFIWSNRQVHFLSINGHRDDNLYDFGNWIYQPDNHYDSIPQTSLSVHINLWLYQNTPPSDQREVEVVIRKFVFEPY